MEFDTHKFYVLESKTMRFMCYQVICLHNVLHMYDVRAGINIVVRMEHISEKTSGHIVFKTPEYQPCRIRNAKIQDIEWLCEGMKYPGTAKQFFRWLRCLAGLGDCKNVVEPIPVEESGTTNADDSHKQEE